MLLKRATPIDQSARDTHPTGGSEPTRRSATLHWLWGDDGTHNATRRDQKMRTDADSSRLPCVTLRDSITSDASDYLSVAHAGSKQKCKVENIRDTGRTIRLVLQ